MTLNRVLVAAFLIAAAVPLPARSQYEGLSGAGFSGTGITQIERMPETVRLQVAVLSKAANLKEALSGLKTRVEASRKKVESLGARPDSIKIEPAKVASEKSDRQRQMEAMVASRMRSKGKKGKQPAKAQPVIVSASMTAEFPLKSKEHEALLIEVQTLEEAIKAADLAGREAATKLTPEEQELQEEMAEQMSSYGSEEESKPGDPVLIFVASISETDRDKAMAEAFKKASAEAGRTAKAAGVELGSLKYVSSAVSSGAEGEDYSSYGNRSYQTRLMLQRMSSAAGLGSRRGEALEATGITPGLVKCTVTVNLGYGIGGK